MKGRVLFGAAMVIAVAATGCQGRNKGIANGTGGRPGTASGGMGMPGSGGAGMAGMGGRAGATACAGPSDARLVVADQRVVRLTWMQVANTVEYLIDATEAQKLVADVYLGKSDVHGHYGDLVPANEQDVSANEFEFVEHIAQHVADYVLSNFAGVTACSSPTDACATTYLNRVAARAYRRNLTADEQLRLTALYQRLRADQDVNGYLVSFTVEEATSHAVRALLTSPQMIWRQEFGDVAMVSSSPPGLPLTDQELATQLAFFLTDHPPDELLLADANSATLEATLGTHVTRLLATATAQNRLRAVFEAQTGVDRLRSPLPVSPATFPAFSAGPLQEDMFTEARMFLDSTLWNGVLTDLLLSRTTFLNTRLAESIYKVPAPVGATVDKFVQTTLPMDQRSGLLTNAGFLTALPFYAALAGSQDPLSRGEGVAALLLCLPPPGRGQDIGAPDLSQSPTAQERFAARTGVAQCATCHAQFDPYGLALDNYDVVGRYRTVDEQGRPIDAHATLPDPVGGTVTNAVELAAKLAASPAFRNCVARVLLRTAVVDATPPVEVPLLPQQPGCAVASAVQRYDAAGGKTFADLVRAVVAAPAFGLRRAAP